MSATATRQPAAAIWKSPAAWNLVFVLVLWLWWAGELSFEWSVSEQYGYGLFVPFLGGYLLWLRMQDIPPAHPWGRSAPVLAVLVLVALAMYPIAVLFEANADWRMLAWGQALLSLACTVLLLAHWGGWAWVKHFVPALALFLFAVPWPSLIEITVVDHLMSFVAAVSTELLNLLGYDAVQMGNIIRLPNSFVEVEEACSGVRSVQSTLMAGWLFGEMWRFGLMRRIGLIVWATAVAIGFNLLRTFILSLLAAQYGTDITERWHDTAGYTVFTLSFLTVLAGAYFVCPKKGAGKKTESSRHHTIPHPSWLPVSVVAFATFLMLGAAPICAAWYKVRGSEAPKSLMWSLNLPAAAPGVSTQPPQPGLRQALFYDSGEQASWKDTQGRQWLLYYFVWDHPRAAELGGVHNPDRCLPSVGWVMQMQGPVFKWSRRGVDLIFNTYEFDNGTTRLFVFNCQWDPAGYPYFEKNGRYKVDRLTDAWRGDRKQDKRVLEIGVSNVPNLDDATKAVNALLEKAITVAPN